MTGDDNGRVIRILVRFYESIQKKKKRYYRISNRYFWLRGIFKHLLKKKGR